MQWRYARVLVISSALLKESFSPILAVLETINSETVWPSTSKELTSSRVLASLFNTALPIASIIPTNSSFLVTKSVNGGEVKSMIRYEVGEGMEKRSENFAEEVAKQING